MGNEKINLIVLNRHAFIVVDLEFYPQNIAQPVVKYSYI